MRTVCFPRKGMRLVLVLASWLLLASVYPGVQAASAAPEAELRGGSRHLILILADHVTGEDFIRGNLPSSALFTERGGAGFMHTLSRRQSQFPGHATSSLQLDATGIPLIMDGLQQAGVVVHRLPEATMYQQEALFPGGKRVDTERIGIEIRKLLEPSQAEKSQLVVVEFTALGKVEADKNQLDEKQYIRYRQAALSSLNVLTRDLVNLSAPSTWVVLATTQQEQPPAQRTQKQLQLLFTAGGHVPPQSFLTSASTRRPGIVTGGDAAASVFRYFDVSQPDGVTGQPIFGTAHSMNMARDLQKMWLQMQETYLRRPAVIIIYGIFAASLLSWMVLGGLAWRRTGVSCAAGFPTKQTSSLLVFCATALLTAPLVFLVLPMNSILTGFVWTAAVIFGLASLTMGLLRIKNLLARIGVLAALNLGVIIGDCLTGGHLARQSVLSYDPVVGIRFYGVGNEYMGVIVAWFLLGCASLFTLWPKGRTLARWMVPMMGMGLALFFALPGYGSNAGGTLTVSLAAAAAAIFLLKPGKLKAWGISILFAVAPIILMIAMHRQEPLPTHISMAGSLLQHGNFQQLLAFILRKLAMNFRLINEYAGGVFAWVGLGVLVSVAVQPNRLVTAFLTKHAVFGTFARTAVWAALAAFLSNDSGVVAAAMILLPVLSVTGMIILIEAIPIPDTVLPSDASLLGSPDFSFGTDQGR